MDDLLQSMAMLNSSIQNVGNAYLTNRVGDNEREFAEKMYHQQVEDNRINWQMQNEYNHPAAQVERLLAAGINPASFFGKNMGDTGNTGTPDAATPLPWTGRVPAGMAHISPLEQLGAVLSAEKTKAEIKQIGGDTRRLDALTDNLQWNTALTELKSEEQKIRNRYLPQKEANEVNQGLANINKTLQEANELFAKAEYDKAIKVLTDAETNLKNQEYLFNNTEFPIKIANLIKTGEQIAATTKAENARAGLYGSQSAYFGQLRLTEKARTSIEDINAKLANWSYSHGESTNQIEARTRALQAQANILGKELGLKDTEIQKAQVELEKAGKENNVWYASWIMNNLFQLANATSGMVNAFKPGMTINNTQTNPLPYTGAGPFTPLPQQMYNPAGPGIFTP